MSLVCPYCGKPVAEEFNFCCGEAGHAIPEAEYEAAYGEREGLFEAMGLEPVAMPALKAAP